jgi:hypothetical protein
MRLKVTYMQADAALGQADRSLAMNSTMKDPAYIAAWLARHKAHKSVVAARAAYRAHVERHKCQSGIFTDAS